MYSQQIKIGLCAVSVFALLASFVSKANAQDLFGEAVSAPNKSQEVQKKADINPTIGQGVDLGDSNNEPKPNAQPNQPSNPALSALKNGIEDMNPKNNAGSNNDAFLPAANNAPISTSQSSTPAGANVPPRTDSSKSYTKSKNRVVSKELFDVSSDLFRQMANIERQNALLALELKREQMLSEIEAVKRQRRLALQEEIYKKEEARRKQVEWESEQTRKQQEFEAKKQENENVKVIKSLRDKIEEKTKEFEEYKEEVNKKYSILIEAKNQRIAELTNQFRILKQEKDQIEVDAKSKIKAIMAAAKDLIEKQAAALAEAKAKAAAIVSSENGGGDTNANTGTTDQTVNSTYAVLEVKGTGKDMTAKILNRDGLTFVVKNGTILNTGHKVIKIAKTHVVVAKNGKVDQIQFPAGGALDKEISSESPLLDVLSSSSAFNEEKDGAKESSSSSDLIKPTASKKGKTKAPTMAMPGMP